MLLLRAVGREHQSPRHTRRTLQPLARTPQVRLIRAGQVAAGIRTRASMPGATKRPQLQLKTRKKAIRRSCLYHAWLCR